MISLKGQVGCDFTGYLSRYVNFQPSLDLLKINFEIGWYLVEYIVYFFQLPYQLYTVLAGIMGSFFLFKSLSTTRSQGLLVMIFPIIVIQLGLSGLRQWVATTIITFIFSEILFLKSKLLLRHLIFLVLAASFHISSLIVLVFIPFFIKLKPWMIIFFVFVGILSLSSNFLNSIYQTYEFRYLERGRESSGAWIRFCFTSILAIIGTFNGTYKQKLFTLCIISIGIILGNIDSIALHRINFYFLPITVLVLLKNHKVMYINKSSLQLAYFLSISYMIFWFAFSTHSHCIVPYHFFFR